MDKLGLAIFRIIIPLAPEGSTTQKTTQKIMKLVKEKPEITKKELAKVRRYHGR